MKYSALWLHEWVQPDTTREAVCDKLTMSGLEVEECLPVAADFSGILVGEVLQVDKHPAADRLHLCQVDVGSSKPCAIVCGAPNVQAGIKVAVAMLNAVMPDKTVIKPATIRGVASEGMLCSASELHLPEKNKGLLLLPADAPVGEDLRVYLGLTDFIFDISITPNRGDCLSIKGLAREIAALTQSSLKARPIPTVTATQTANLPIVLTAPEACPRYIGRIIHQVKADLTTPLWMQERLRRSGVNSISPIVDVTNYVMLELGQPMHAFDLDKIQAGIEIRYAKPGEKITLLDGSEPLLDEQTLVIADHIDPLAIAGVMGGLNSSVTLTTSAIFLESAYFSPQTVTRQRQHYHLNSDSSYRFERGVDFTLQREAMERATQLICDICGGEPGPLLEVVNEQYLPTMPTITLTAEKISQLLGLSLPVPLIETIFNQLQFSWTKVNQAWQVSPPPYRFDISLPEDLIEEIARLYGYDKLPTRPIKAFLQTHQPHDIEKDWYTFRQVLSDHGYHEIISYSFVDKKRQHLLNPTVTPQALLNPITADMAVMRTNLWPGLIHTFLYNQSRQQQRIRLFEIGVSFVEQPAKAIAHEPRLAGLISGAAQPEQWGAPTRMADFYDLKGDIENLLALTRQSSVFKPDAHPALHPGQTAAIYLLDSAQIERRVGIMGALHPQVMEVLGLTEKVFVFELDVTKLALNQVYSAQEVAKFPEIRRDLAILLNQTIPAKAIQDTITEVVGDWLKDIFIFDVYQGKGIKADQKSIALALILQHPMRTLVDEEVAERMEQVVAALRENLGAELRS